MWIGKKSAVTFMLRAENVCDGKMEKLCLGADLSCRGTIIELHGAQLNGQGREMEKEYPDRAELGWG